MASAGKKKFRQNFLEILHLENLPLYTLYIHEAQEIEAPQNRVNTYIHVLNSACITSFKSDPVLELQAGQNVE